MNRLLLFDPRVEVFALEHLLQSDATVQSDNLLVIHFSEPVAVENGFSSRRIENLEGLVPISLGVFHYLFASQLRTRR